MLVIDSNDYLVYLFTLILLALNGLVNGHSNEEGPSADVKHHAIIIDCGSSGSRASIYHWEPLYDFPELFNKIEPRLNPENNKPLSFNVDKPLSVLDGQESSTYNYFKPIRNFIEEHLTVHERANSGVLILGTAGMRLLPDKLRESITEQATQYFIEDDNFVFVKTGVISGADEGMFMWLTVNSRLNLFASAQTADPKPFVGVIEMGGASVQVTYKLNPLLEHRIRMNIGMSEAQVNFDELFAYPDITKIKREYKLVSPTFLGLGSNRARDAYFDLLVFQELKSELRPKLFDYFKEKKSLQFGKRRLILNDPCFPRGYKMTDTEYIKKPKAMSRDPKWTVGFSIDNQTDTFDIELIGTSNYEHCLANVTELMNKIKEEKMNCTNTKTSPCSISMLSSKFVPFDEVEFYGIGDFAHTVSYVGMKHGPFNPAEMRARTKTFCNLSHDQIMESNPDINQFDKQRSRTECFKAVWVDVLLTQGFKIPEKPFDFKIQPTIEGRKLEWTLGAAIEKSYVVETAIASNPEVISIH